MKKVTIITGKPGVGKTEELKRIYNQYPKGSAEFIYAGQHLFHSSWSFENCTENTKIVLIDFFNPKDIFHLLSAATSPKLRVNTISKPVFEIDTPRFVIVISEEDMFDLEFDLSSSRRLEIVEKIKGQPLQIEIN